MMPFVRTVGALAYGTDALNVPLPATYHLNDILVLIIATAYGEAISATGWAHAPDSPSESAAGGVRLNVLWRRATGSDAAVTTDSGDHQVARIVAIGSVELSGSPWNVTAKGNGATTDITVPGDTTTLPDGLALVAVGVAQFLDQEGFISGWTNTDLTAITEIFDSVKNVGSGGGISLISGEAAAAGVIGNTTATQQAAGDYAGWFGVLKADTTSGSGAEVTSNEPLSSEEPQEPPNEFQTSTFSISTWQFDTQEDDPADRDPIDWFLAWQLMDQNEEAQDKLISAIRVTGKLTDGEVQIHAASPGEQINKTDIEEGTGYRAHVTFPDSTNVTRYERKKVKIKKLSIWTARISGTWDGLNGRDRLDELVIEGGDHGITK